MTTAVRIMVGYAMTRSLKPANGSAPTWSKFVGNPIVHCVEDLVGTGHHSFFTDKEGRLRIVFHAHDSESEVAPRRMYIGTMEFVGNKLQMTDEPIIRPTEESVLPEQTEAILSPSVSVISNFIANTAYLFSGIHASHIGRGIYIQQRRKFMKN